MGLPGHANAFGQCPVQTVTKAKPEETIIKIIKKLNKLIKLLKLSGYWKLS